MIEKIQKLLSLANSCNESEAQAAFQKAKSLADKYNLELELIAIQNEQENEKLPFEEHEIMQGKLPVIHKYIVHLMQDYFHVKVIYFTRNRQTRLSFIGRKDRIIIAKEVYNQLISVFDYLWKVYKVKYNLQTNAKASYMFGLSEGFKTKLKEQESSTKDEVILNLPQNIQNICKQKLEIVLLNETRELENAVNEFHPKLGFKRTSSINVTRRDVYQDGYNDGQTINLNKNKALAVS